VSVDAALQPLVAMIAKAVAAELAAEFRRSTVDPLVDRKTAPISKRAWDAYAGKPGGFPAYRDGRRVVAKRSDVLAWLETARVISPRPADLEDEAALAAAGVR